MIYPTVIHFDLRRLFHCYFKYLCTLFSVHFAQLCILPKNLGNRIADPFKKHIVFHQLRFVQPLPLVRGADGDGDQFGGLRELRGGRRVRVFGELAGFELEIGEGEGLVVEFHVDKWEFKVVVVEYFLHSLGECLVILCKKFERSCLVWVDGIDHLYLYFGRI
jgi:hypothetical protein